MNRRRPPPSTLPAIPEVRLNVSGDSPLDDPAFDRMLESQLPRLLPARRWFVSKARSIRTLRVVEQIVTDSGDASTRRAVFLINVEFTEGEPDSTCAPVVRRP